MDTGLLGHQSVESTQIHTQVSIRAWRAVHASTHSAEPRESPEPDAAPEPPESPQALCELSCSLCLCLHRASRARGVK